MKHLARVVVRAAKPIIRAHSGFVGSVVAVDTAVRNIVLTYDDGPEPGGTDSILKVLDERQLSATFFVLLSRARRHQGLLGEVAAAGHEIALHGLDHRRLTGFSFREVAQRTRDGRAELEDLIGSRVEWVRPPYGRQTLASWRAVQIRRAYARHVGCHELGFQGDAPIGPYPQGNDRCGPRGYPPFARRSRWPGRRRRRRTLTIAGQGRANRRDRRCVRRSRTGCLVAAGFPATRNSCARCMVQEVMLWPTFRPRMLTE